MTIIEYEAHIRELARHATFILDTKYERVHCFVSGLILPIYICTQILVVVGRSAEVLDHARAMKEMHLGHKEVIIRVLNIRVFSMVAVVVHDS